MTASEIKDKMEGQFTLRAGLTTALIVGLLGLHQLSGYLRHSDGVKHRLYRLISDISANPQSRDEVDALTEGYYEQLRPDAGPGGLPNEKDDVQFRNDFLRFELRPNLSRPYYNSGRRVTNSMGMANPEYSYAKPLHTRRIALLGDSQSLGPYGQDYVALLENRLNQNCRTPDIQNYQVLNFSVYGYSVLQMMDVALDKAPLFHPDAYVVAMTGLETLPGAGWRAQVGRLVTSRTDLKYDYLRQVVAQAGIQPTSRLPSIIAKLGPYINPVITWALSQIRDHAAAQGATMVIFMIPSPINPDFTSDDFDRMRKPIDTVGVPVIDLRDTYRNVNLDDIQVAPGKDFHPNVRGHALIADSLFNKLQEQPDALLALAGDPCQLALPSSATGK
jgi:hypothetical protein